MDSWRPAAGFKRVEVGIRYNSATNAGSRIAATAFSQFPYKSYSNCENAVFLRFSFGLVRRPWLRDLGATALDENSQHDHEEQSCYYLDDGYAVHTNLLSSDIL